MKKIIFLAICSFFILVRCSMKNKRQYEVCKANCSVGCGCGLDGFRCEHNCYKTFCRNNCFEKYNKECKACFENSKEKGQCFDSPACKKRCTCLDECRFIYDVSSDSHKSSETSCSDCYCFKSKTKEFIGKINNLNNQCLFCNASCKKAYSVMDKAEGVEGVCRKNPNEN